MEAQDQHATPPSSKVGKSLHCSLHDLKWLDLLLIWMCVKLNLCAHMQFLLACLKTQSAWTASCVCTVLNKKKRPFYFWVLSLKGRWSKSAFKNSLWQVHLSITQLPTSVSEGGRQPAGTDLLKYDFSARVQSCVLCVDDGRETARGHQPQNYYTFQFKAFLLILN